MTTLYSLRTDAGDYRITKFVDGDVESSYTLTHSDCTCPAGPRPSCRHRQMLPMMLAHGICDSMWFWNFDNNRVVDFNGQLKSNLDAMTELAAQRTQSVTEQPPEPAGSLTPAPQLSKASWRRL